jgi:hypothetical protein
MDENPYKAPQEKPSDDRSSYSVQVILTLIALVGGVGLAIVAAVALRSQL